MTNHVRMGIIRSHKGRTRRFSKKAREGLAPILRNSPGFVFYSVSNPATGGSYPSAPGRRASRPRRPLPRARSGSARTWLTQSNYRRT